MRKLLFIIGILTFFLSSCESTLKVTVNFDTNGGSDVPSQVFNEESVFTLPNAPTKEGHTFVGWFLDETFDTPFSVEGVLELEPKGPLMLYASWQVNRYTITFDSDGGTEVASITQDYNTPIKSPSNPTKEGFTFTGWSESVPATMPAKNITLYAIWEIRTITVQFVMLNEVLYSTLDYGELISYPETPSEFYFDGWYLDEKFEQKAPLYSNSNSNSLVLYAHLIEKSQVVSVTNKNSMKIIYENNGYIMYDSGGVYRYDYNLSLLWSRSFYSVIKVEIHEDIIFIYHSTRTYYPDRIYYEIASISLDGDDIDKKSYSEEGVSSRNIDFHANKEYFISAIYENNSLRLALTPFNNNLETKSYYHRISIDNNFDLKMYQDSIYLINNAYIYKFDMNLNLIDATKIGNSNSANTCNFEIIIGQINCNGNIFDVEGNIIETQRKFDGYSYFYSSLYLDYYYDLSNYKNTILVYDRYYSEISMYELPEIFRYSSNFYQVTVLLDKFGSLLVPLSHCEFDSCYPSNYEGNMYKLIKIEDSQLEYELTYYIDQVLINSLTLEEGEKIPDFDFYSDEIIILGWYLDSEFTQELDFAYMPSENVNIYAKIAKYELVWEYTENSLFAGISNSYLSQDGSIVYIGSIDDNITEIQIIKFDYEGELVFKKEINYLSTYVDLIVDENENIYIIGNYGGPFTDYPVVIKLDSDGEKIWEYIHKGGATDPYFYNYRNKGFEKIEFIHNNLLYLKVFDGFVILNLTGEVVTTINNKAGSFVFENRILVYDKQQLYEFDIETELLYLRVGSEDLIYPSGYKVFTLGEKIIISVKGFAYVYDRNFNLLETKVYYGPTTNWRQYDNSNFYNFSDSVFILFNIESLTFTYVRSDNFHYSLIISNQGFYTATKVDTNILFQFFSFIIN